MDQSQFAFIGMSFAVIALLISLYVYSYAKKAEEELTEHFKAQLRKDYQEHLMNNQKTLKECLDLQHEMSYKMNEPEKEAINNLIMSCKSEIAYYEDKLKEVSNG